MKLLHTVGALFNTSTDASNTHRSEVSSSFTMTQHELEQVCRGCACVNVCVCVCVIPI